MGDHRFNPAARGNLINSGALEVCDAYGRPLKKGDSVILPGIIAPQFRVHQITPNLDRGAPPNTLKVIMIARLDWIAMSRAANSEFILVRTVEEIETPATAPVPPGIDP